MRFNPAKQERSEAVRQAMETYASDAGQYADQQTGNKMVFWQGQLWHVHIQAHATVKTGLRLPPIRRLPAGRNRLSLPEYSDHTQHIGRWSCKWEQMGVDTLMYERILAVGQ